MESFAIFIELESIVISLQQKCTKRAKRNSLRYIKCVKKIASLHIYKNMNLNKYLQFAKTDFPRTNRKKLIVLRQMETLYIRR